MSYRVGAARVKITPKRAVALAGYSVGGPQPTNTACWEDLFATVLYLSDDSGGGPPEEVALCTVDLHSGMRPLWVLAAEQAEREIGLDRGRLLISGTHTHSGPGRMYGSMYDLLAHNPWFYDEELAKQIAGNIAEAVIQAKRGAVAGYLAIGTRNVWGLGSNQSLPAFMNHPEGRRWSSPGRPGSDAPEGLSAVERAVDPRLTALAGVDEDGRIRGILGLFGTHATALGKDVDYYSPDWCGPAAATAALHLRSSGAAHEDLVVGFGASCMGDVGPLPLMPTESGRPSRQGPELQHHIGSRLGRALGEIGSELAMRRERPALRVSHGIWEIDVEHDRKLAAWHFGRPTVGGSEDGRSFLGHLVHEGALDDDGFPDDHPQHPKRALPNRLGLVRLRPPQRLPLHVVRLGTTALASVPGEPTTLTGWEITRALRAIEGIEEVRVLGYTNEYAGYFTTTEEFEMQHYEGSSTIYGKYQVVRLIEELRRLAELPTMASPAPEAPDRHEHLQGWRAWFRFPRALRV